MKDGRQYRPEQYEEGGDSDADAFAALSILVILALAIVYYLSN